MPGNCLLIISKNEGINPIAIAEQAIDSEVVEKVIISDGSNRETFNRLKDNQTNKIEVIPENKYVDTNTAGKGIGMINGGLAALKEGYEKIGYIDGDISSPNIGKWFEFLFDPLYEGIDVVKASFLRHPTDGQITRHITKPLIAMFFPNAWEINQPLGGELALKKEVIKDLFTKGSNPPYGWGIDTFILLKSLMFGYNVGEVFLGQKIHNKKTLTHLRKMFDECFLEAVQMIKLFYSMQVRKKIRPIIRLPSPFKKDAYFDCSYMDLKKEIIRSLESFKLMKKMYIPHDDIFYDIVNASDTDSFYKKSQLININVWVEMLYWFIKKYSPELIDQYYLRWKIRALSFCLHEINTFEQAETRTAFQAKSALDFMQKIGERSTIDDSSKQLYFYKDK
jgi:glucosyl-3-phosphoglycerate synthase